MTSNADGTSSQVATPREVAVGPNGSIYFAEPDKVRQLTADGTLRLIFGGGTKSGDPVCSAGEQVTALPCSEVWPYPIGGIAVDSDGSLYVSENKLVRKITNPGTAACQARVVASYCNPGFEGGSNLYQRGLALDSAGNVYVADSINSVIRKLTPSGTFTVFAGQLGQAGNMDGQGRNALLNYPHGIAIDATDTLYVTERNRIRKITSDGMVSTLAGGSGGGCVDGPMANATFDVTASGVALDANGNLYFPSNTALIRQISPAGQVTTIAGTRTDSTDAGCKVATGWQDGAATQAKFSHPQGIAVDTSGSIYVADYDNKAIRKLTPVN